MTKKEHLKQELEKIDNLIQDCIKTTQEKIKQNTPLTNNVKHFNFRKKGYKICLWGTKVNTPLASVYIKNKLTTSLKFSIHQIQGLNIEDYHIYIITDILDITKDYFEYDYNVHITKDDYLIEEEKKVAIENLEIKFNKEKKLAKSFGVHTFTDFQLNFGHHNIDFEFEYHMTPKRGSIDLLLKRIEKEIQKLTQWRRGGNDLGKKGYVKLLDLPHAEYGTPIILFDEDGNRIKY